MMRTRIHAIRTISANMLFEMFISPGFYISLTIGLAAGYALVFGFVRSIGSSGFNFDQPHIIYNILIKFILNGLFGMSFVRTLFAEGPYFFALLAASVPMLLYLSLSTAFKFGFEKNVGAVELIAYGPSDGTCYCIASLVKNTIAMLVTLVVLFLFFGLSALLHNLNTGYAFLGAIPVLAVFSAALFSYAVAASVATGSESPAVALFLCITLFFAVIETLSLAMVGTYVRNLSGTIAAGVKWFSPFYFWHASLDALGYGNAGNYIINLLLLLLLAIVLVTASHFILRKKGVRG